MIYLFLTDGFEEMEAIAPIDLLRRAGIDLKTVGLDGKTATGSHGVCVVCDIAQSEFDLSDCSGVILPGGPGHKALAQSPLVQQTLRHVAKCGGLLAAICAAPAILGQAGYLKNRRACCYPGFEDKLLGADVLYDPVITDGNVITSRGAGTATAFALAMIAYLVSPKKAAEIAAEIQHER